MTQQSVIHNTFAPASPERVFAAFADAEGGEILLTHQAAFFEGADGPQIREAGWRKLLDRLAKGLAS